MNNRARMVGQPIMAVLPSHTFVSDGTTRKFPLPYHPGSAVGLMVWVNRQIQVPNSQYQVTTQSNPVMGHRASLELTVAASEGQHILVRYVGLEPTAIEPFRIINGGTPDSTYGA